MRCYYSLASWRSHRRVKKKVYTTTENTSSLLDCPGRMDTINLIVLFVLYAVIILKVCLEMLTKQEERSLSGMVFWMHISLLKIFQNQTNSQHCMVSSEKCGKGWGEGNHGFLG